MAAMSVVPRLAVSPAEAAASLGMSRAAIYRAMSDGLLRSVKCNGRRLIPLSAIYELLGEPADASRVVPVESVA